MTDRRRPGAARQGPQARRLNQARPATYPAYDEPPEGRRIGPFPISPTGILLVIAMIGSIAYILFAITARDAAQIPLLASGAVVLGVVFVGVAIAGLVATWRSSVRGRDGRALAHALVGGIACLAAAGCFAAAIILGMVSRTP